LTSPLAVAESSVTSLTVPVVTRGGTADEIVEVHTGAACVVEAVPVMFSSVALAWKQRVCPTRLLVTT
jgi:hypothetical protein